MEIGAPEEGLITDMVTFAGRLLVVKEAAVYEVQTADRIDPTRTNAKLPNSQRKILSVGSQSPLLGKTFLTVYRIFCNNASLKINLDAAMNLASRSASALSSMEVALNTLDDHINMTEINLTDSRLSEGFILPYFSDLESAVKSFLHNSDIVSKTIISTIKLFYDNVSHADSLKHLSDQVGSETDFGKFLIVVFPVLKFVREARNAIEHPRENQWVKVTNFLLLPSGQVQEPLLEIMYHDSHQEPVAIVHLFREWINSLSAIYEVSIAHLAAQNSNFSGFDSTVIELDPATRRDKHVRFSLALKIGGEWAPLG